MPKQTGSGILTAGLLARIAMALLRWTIPVALLALSATVYFATYKRIGEVGKPAPPTVEVHAEAVPEA